MNTKEGGKKVSATIRAKYGDDFWKKIGSEGGKVGHTGGFCADRERARIAGTKGGTISRRTGVKNKPRPEYIDVSLLGKLKRLFRRRFA